MLIRVGTASWASKTLVDSRRFYPPGVNSAEDRLRYYASRFPLVEVDSSYYALPAAATTQLWAERTPQGFMMNVKAFRLFTGHQTAPAALPKEVREALPPTDRRYLYQREMPVELVDELWRRFAEALEPLQRAGRLGLVHFQFAPWVVRNAAGHAHVRACVDRLPRCVLSVEFRHRSWFDTDRALVSTLAFERELGVVHTVVDAPRGFENSVPAVWDVTHPGCALLRLHGRNHETWNLKGAVDSSERFDYDYCDDELERLAQGAQVLAAQAAEVHVVFNNNMEDQGQRNAATMMQFLESTSPRQGEPP